MILDTDEKLEFDITMLGKRVMEIKMAYDLNQFDLIPDILNRYDKQLDKLLTEVRNNSIKPITPTGVWKRDYLELALGTHIRVLNEVYGKSSSDDNFNQGLKQLIDKIIFKGNQLYLFPSHNIDNLDQFERINEFEFKAVKNGEYDLIFPGLVKCASIIDPSQIKIDYEGNLINGTIIGDDIVFKVNIQADNVVFRLLTSQLNNLYTEIDDITLNSNKNKQYEYEITNFCPGLSYKINVDYYVRSGFSPKLSFIQNNDKLVNGEYERSFDLRLPQGNYWFDTQNYGIVVGSRNTADKAKLSLMVDKWSNCAEFGNNFKKCEDQQFLNLNSKESESVINNINITLFEYPKPYLIKLNNESNVEYDLINYQRLAPYKYLLKLSNIKSSKILVLSETFNSGWNIGGLNRPHFVVNAYANGWLINPGDEGEYIVEFGPQKLLEYANLVSGLSIIILVLFLYVKKND